MRIKSAILLMFLSLNVLAMEREYNNKKYLPLFVLIENVTDFLLDNTGESKGIAIASKHSDYKNDNALQLELKQINENIKNNTNEWLDSINNLVRGATSENDVLHKFLEERAARCIQRFLSIIHIDRNGYEGRFPVPTDPRFFRILYTKKEDIKINQEIAHLNRTYFQMLDMIIAKLYHLCDKEKLSKKTKKLIKAQPSLWPILQNKNHTSDEHQDSIGGYAILIPYMEKYESVDDIRLAIKKFLKNEPKKQQEKNILDVRYLDANFDFIKRKLAKKEDVYFSIPLLGLGIPRDNQGIIYLHPANEKCFFKVVEKCVISIHSNRIIDIINTNDYYHDLLPEMREAIGGILPPQENLPLPSFKFLEINEDNSCYGDDDLSSFDRDSMFEFFSHKEPEIIQIGNDKNNNDQPSVVSNHLEKRNGELTKTHDSKEKVCDFQLPNGLRKFNNIVFLPVQKNVDPHLQKEIDVLFSNDGSNIFNYAKFEQLWISLKGTIGKGTGSSHFILYAPSSDINKRGKKVGSIFSHGKNTKYNNYIKYLRAAVYIMGYRPTVN